MWLEILAAGCLVWYFFILCVCAIGFFQLKRHYSKPTPEPLSPTIPISEIPHITVIRPVKGVEPYLYECLAATFHQSYASSKLTVYFCISLRNDPALPILLRLLADFPAFDAKIFIEEEDPNLSGHNGSESNLGPNPKIRNMSRAYREANGDIIWIIDCNVWISPSVAGLMVDRLCGLGPTNNGRKYKFVHQLPLVVDVSNLSPPASPQISSTFASFSGGLLEELFLSTSHAKFYTAISTVAIAPCTVGKSNMFRRSHLNALTLSLHPLHRSPGIDFFSDNICEDHLIGDLLWRTPVPISVLDLAGTEGQSSSTNLGKQNDNWGNHALLPSPPCIQPLAHLPTTSYLARRTRWLRVRKFTVPLATLVEPGTESLVCSLCGAFGFTTLPLFNHLLHIPRTWVTFWIIWIISVLIWMSFDYLVWRRLQSWAGEAEDKAKGNVPPFVGCAMRRTGQRGKRQWLLAWLGREMLAGPIWVIAIFGGAIVRWRGRTFKVGMDARVKEVGGVVRNRERNGHGTSNGYGNGNEIVGQGKKRQD